MIVLGARWATSISGLICLPIVPLIIFRMPETLPAERREQLQCGNIRVALNSQYLFAKAFQKDRRMRAVLVVYFAAEIVTFSLTGGALLHWGQWKFGWDVRLQGLAVTVALVSGVVGSTLVSNAVKWSGGEPKTTYSLAIAGSTCVWAISCASLGFSTSSFSTLASLSFFGLGLGTIPAICSQISAAARSDRQGGAQGFVNAVGDMAWVVGRCLYSFTLSQLNNAGADMTGQSVAYSLFTSSMMWWFSCSILALGAYFLSSAATDDVEEHVSSGNRQRKVAVFL